MLIDLSAGAPERLDADVAVIGAGAAGITVARHLLSRGLTVLLLESGGLDHDAESSDLNAGESVGQSYYELERSRLRFFGGTTAIWGGRCAHLDPIDFEKRSWVAHSGWPITAEELAPWYELARPLVGLPPRRSRFEGLDRAPARLNGGEIAINHWEFDHEFDRFGAARNRDLFDHPRLTILLHATVREVVALQSGLAISHLDVRGPSGASVEVRAGDYVLAAGGIENARLLLASQSVMPAGLGNQNDLVGRFFMEHPHARGGTVRGAPAWELLRFFANRTMGDVVAAPLLTATERFQRENGLLNSALTIAARRPLGGQHSLVKRAYLHAKHKVEPTTYARSLWKTQRLAGRTIKHVIGPLFPWLDYRSRRSELTVVLRAEQAPNPSSRVTLTDQRDALGMPRVRLDWRISEQDVRTASELVRATSRAFAKAALGHIEPAGWLEKGEAWEFDPLVSAHPIGAFHHMGTTRMASDPKQGVTDAYGRVHGLANLFVAGTSLFPTGGWANPTLPMLALALRTSDHIAVRRSLAPSLISEPPPPEREAYRAAG